MLSERTAELIQASIDGELAGDRESELAAALEHSAEARQFQVDMSRVGQMIADLPEVDPPAGLTRRILDNIELPVRSRLARWSADFASAWLKPTSYGLAVAAGVLIAVGVVYVTPQHPDDVRQLVGTMVRGGHDLPGAVSGELDIELAMLHGQIRWKDLDQAWALEFDLRSDDAVEIAIDTYGSSLEFGGFARQDGNSGLDAIEVSGSKLRVMNRGSHQFVLFLRDKAEAASGTQEIVVLVNHRGAEVYRGSLGGTPGDVLGSGE